MDSSKLVLRLARAAAICAVVIGCSTTKAQLPSWATPPPGEMRKTLVQVMPIQLDRSKGLDIASSEELTQLMVDKLQRYDVPAVSFEANVSGPSLYLACEVTDLSYAQSGGYPRRLMYKAQLSCTLKEPVTQEVRWSRKLNEQYEESVLLNTMTKRPEHHDAVLYRETVVPLWDAMAYGVRLFLSRPIMRAPTAPAPAAPSLPMVEPAPSPYVK